MDRNTLVVDSLADHIKAHSAALREQVSQACTTAAQCDCDDDIAWEEAYAPVNCVLSGLIADGVRSFGLTFTAVDILLSNLLEAVENVDRSLQASRQAILDTKSIAGCYETLQAIASGCQLLLDLAGKEFHGTIASASDKDSSYNSHGDADIAAIIIRVSDLEKWFRNRHIVRMTNKFPTLRKILQSSQRVRNSKNKPDWNTRATTAVVGIGVTGVALLLAVAFTKFVFGGALDRATQSVVDTGELVQYKYGMLRQWDAAANQMALRGLPPPAALQTGDMVVALPRDTLLTEFQSMSGRLSRAVTQLSWERVRAVSVGACAGAAVLAAEVVGMDAAARFIEDDSTSKRRTTFAVCCDRLRLRLQASSAKSAADAAVDVSEGTSPPPFESIDDLARDLSSLLQELADVMGFFKHLLAGVGSEAALRVCSKMDAWFTRFGFGIEKPTTSIAEARRAEQVMQPSPLQRWRALQSWQPPMGRLPNWYVWESTCLACTENINPAVPLIRKCSARTVDDTYTQCLCARMHVMCVACASKWMQATSSRSALIPAQSTRRTPLQTLISSIQSIILGEDINMLQGAQVPCPTCRETVEVSSSSLSVPLLRSSET